MNYDKKIIDCGCIAVFWLLAIFVVNPSGNFPLNDDWAYATDVKNFLETGIFNPTGWTSMSLLTHVLWGALWSSVFGFSFEVLRVSTLAISLVCLCNIYLTGREMGASRPLSLLLAFTLAFNPIYFALSFTFMTEVSFLAFVSFAVLFFIRFLKNDSLVNWCFAFIFCIIATLSRQTGLFLPLAFVFIFVFLIIFQFWIKFKDSRFMFSTPQPPLKGEMPIERESSPPLEGAGGWKSINPTTRNPQLVTRLLLATLPILLSFAALKLFESHMFATGKIQALYGLQVDELKYLLLNVPEILPLRVLKNTYQASLYLGLMGLPVWLFLAWRIAVGHFENVWHHKSINSLEFKPYAIDAFVMISFPILFLIGVIINDSQMPTLVGIVEASGIGPRTLHDAYFLQISSDNLPDLFWKIVTYASAAGAGLMWALLVCGILFSFKKEKNNTLGVGTITRQTFPKCLTSNWMGLFFLLSAAIYFVPFALVGFYDRYLLPLMMVVPLGVVGLWTQFLTRRNETKVNVSPFGEGFRGWKTLVILPLILMTIFSIISTHDYLAWNRARWQALDDLTVNENIPTTHIDGGFEFGGWYNFHEIEVEMNVKKSWWWVTEDDYVLTFNEIDGYDIHSKYKYNSWWKGEQFIFVLTKCPT